MAINPKRVKKYFEENAALWVKDGYDTEGYNYPVGFHRARIVAKYLVSLKKKNLNVLDLGCGSGDISFLLAKHGFNVTGVDQSRNMLDLANEKRKKMPKAIQDRTIFVLNSVDKIDIKKKYDVVIAMGFIGYFKNDKYIFDIVRTLLKPEGYFLVSCRNRLFNMVSFSDRTKNEIAENKAIGLIDEIRSTYKQIPIDDINRFVLNLKETVKKMPSKWIFDKEQMKSPSEKLGIYKSSSKFEPRQNTPDGIKKVAIKSGFKHEAYFGVHPHLLDPNLNELLPPQLFNKISSSFEVFENLPISLTWSSVFIGVFKKR